MDRNPPTMGEVCDTPVTNNHGGMNSLTHPSSSKMIVHFVFCILYLFIRKCRKKWRGGLKETIELMLIRPPQLQFFKDGIKITATDTKQFQVEN